MTRRSAKRASAESPGEAGPTRRSAAGPALQVAALGIVFGDIGTSPLYALQAALSAGGGETATPGGAAGLASLIVWSLIAVVTIKYVILVLRADHHGEGGILALSTLVAAAGRRPTPWVVAAGILGAALFMGDSVLTPAISVLSAVEGLRVAEPGLPDIVVPASVVILVVLFAIQHRGTGKVGQIFGPIMMVWFVCLAALGIPHIAAHPAVLSALTPIAAITFVAAHPVTALASLGAVVLALTGAEALYADLGHFGRVTIRRAWLRVVLPALVINYLGQAALVATDPATARDPFFHLAPTGLRWPLVVLATIATVIASQAVISGTFSLVRQAINLGFLPKMRVASTSPVYRGQIYLPTVNMFLMFAVVVVVIVFKSSGNLAQAYGVAVTCVFSLTITLLMMLARRRWKWHWWQVALFIGTVGLLEAGFLVANLAKIATGGWLPLVIAAIVALVMLTWHTEQRRLVRLRRDRTGLLARFAHTELPTLARVPGTVIYPHSTPQAVPVALRLTVELSQVAAARLIVVHVKDLPVPYARPSERVRLAEVAPSGLGLFEVIVRFGFHEPRDIPGRLAGVRDSDGLPLLSDDTRYVVSDLRLDTTAAGRSMSYRRRLFNALTLLADNPVRQFHLPSTRTVTIGANLPIPATPRGTGWHRQE